MIKMRIAIFTDTFLPQINGVVTATISLIKVLANKGHHIILIAPDFGQSEKFKYNNVEIIQVKGIPALFYEDFRLTKFFSFKVMKIIKEKKIELIHFQTPLMLGVQAIWISRILKLPLVGTFHTLFTDSQYLRHFGMNNFLFQELFWAYARAYYNRCNLITCPSEAAKEALVKNKFQKLIKVISNGIDSSIFDSSKWGQVKAKYNPKGKLLLFVGRLAYEKNLFYLLECFQLVVKKIPETKLLIIGDGPQKAFIETRIKELGLSKNVILTGKIEHEKLIKSSIFKACTLFVTASTTETQGITMLEAQANGLVSVGIDAMGTKDLIKNNYNGYLVKDGDKKAFADAVIKLLENKKLYLKMKKNTLKEIKKHDIKRISSIWEKEYSKLISKQRFLNSKN